MPHPHYTHFSKTPNNAPLLTGPPRGVKCPHLGALFSPSTTHGLRPCVVGKIHPWAFCAMWQPSQQGALLGVFLKWV
ncbi:hypothetical protein HanRHA438_Chr09g0380211 [Helianthus annuus]|nr:hypothetical protein HanRHA438_Chr09g0380211 [Helianthus annuus]